MRKEKKIIFLLTFFLLTAWISIGYKSFYEHQTFKSLIKNAKSFEEKKIYIDAAACYDKALKINPQNLNLIIKYANTCLKLGDTKKFLALTESAKKTDSKDEKAYLLQGKYYLKKSDYSKAIAIFRQGLAKTDNKEIASFLDELNGKYARLYGAYLDVKLWRKGFTLVQNNAGWGVINENGAEIIKPQFKQVESYDPTEKLLPVVQSENNYYVDEIGRRKLVANNSYSDLGSFSEGVATAKWHGRYYYIDRNFKRLSKGFSKVTGMKNGIAMVCNSKKKWAIIDKNFKTITDFSYDDVVVDDNNFCSTNGRLFVKKSGSYMLIDSKGHKIGKHKFKLAKAFISNQAAAVNIDDKWGFIDKDGKLVIEPVYDDAQSFSINLGGFFQNGKWGFVNLQNKVVIEPTFLEIRPFSKQGVAPVKFDKHSWQLIQLWSYRI